MGYYWTTTPELPDEVQAELGLVTEFDDQGQAEAWLTANYGELSQSGAHQVCLFEGDRLVYGPMALDE